MNSKTFMDQQPEMELQPVGSTKNLFSKLAARLNQMWESLCCDLMREREPQISKRRDRFGNIWWTAHDPASGRSYMCSDEQDVRIWLEQIRYR